jgi:hypothetical protein
MADLGSGPDTLIELEGTNRIVYLASPGVIDPRAVLAFTFGQCHGLALALAEEGGLPLVGIFLPKNECRHIAVLRPDGRLLDVTGSHTLAEIAAQEPQSRLAPIDKEKINLLVSDHDWAPPATAAAKAWVGPVLAIADGAPLLPPLSAYRMRKCWEFSGVAVSIEWQGLPWLEVFVRPPGQVDAAWISYKKVGFPPDPVRGVRLIDFSQEFFETLAQNWLDREFDPALAEQRLAGG